MYNYFTCRIYKRTNLTEYKTQNRGGVGQKSAGTRDQDFLEHMFVATNHQYMMFFTQKRKMFLDACL
jgi:DNA gyrase subunit A